MSKPHLLLINPWIYDFSAYDFWSKPAGLLYLATFLRKSGYEVDLIDCMDRFYRKDNDDVPRKKIKLKKFGTGPFEKIKVDKPEILNFVPRYYYRFGVPEDWFREQLSSMKRPDALLLTSIMTYWYPGVQYAANILREVWPDVPLILGGIYATLMPEHARQTIQPDYLICGPGEREVEKVLLKLFPAQQKFVDPNLNELELYPALDLYKHLEYIILMTSRGCPLNCSFCATDKISGRFSQRRPEDVFKELKWQLSQYHIRDVAFYDDALLINKEKRIIPFLKQVIAAHVNLCFHTPNGLHAREINRELAVLFYAAGFKTIRLSFETVNPARLADMKNKVTPGDLQSAVKNLENAGYARKNLDAYVLMGLPHQKIREVYQSILFVHSLGIKIRLASFSPIPGTRDYRRTIEDGLFPPDADPILMNNTIYPLYRDEESYYKFHGIRQMVNVLNDAVDRNVNMVTNTEMRAACSDIASLLMD